MRKIHYQNSLYQVVSDDKIVPGGVAGYLAVEYIEHPGVSIIEFEPERVSSVQSTYDQAVAFADVEESQGPIPASEHITSDFLFVDLPVLSTEESESKVDYDVDTIKYSFDFIGDGPSVDNLYNAQYKGAPMFQQIVPYDSIIDTLTVKNEQWEREYSVGIKINGTLVQTVEIAGGTSGNVFGDVISGLKIEVKKSDLLEIVQLTNNIGKDSFVTLYLTKLNY